MDRIGSDRVGLGYYQLTDTITMAFSGVFFFFFYAWMYVWFTISFRDYSLALLDIWMSVKDDKVRR